MWDRMTKDSDEWNFFLETLWDFHCLKEETPLTDKIKDAFYDECQGITSVAVNLFILAQERALSEEKEKITVTIIRNTAKEDLYMIQPMIKALRNNNILEIMKYEDISINLDEIAINYKGKMELNGKIQDAFKERKKSIELMKRSIVENLILELKLMDMFNNIEAEEINKTCEKVVQESSVGEDYNSLKLKALKSVMELQEKVGLNNKKKEKLKSKSSGLLALYDKARQEKLHPYEVFKDNGYIKNPAEEFLNVN